MRTIYGIGIIDTGNTRALFIIGCVVYIVSGKDPAIGKCAAYVKCLSVKGCRLPR